MNNSIKSIDKKNESIWQSRYNNSSKVESDGLKVLRQSEKVHYARGISYAELNISVANFLQSRNEIALKYLSEAYHWFSSNKSEKGYARALLLKGNIYESFGDYENVFW